MRANPSRPGSIRRLQCKVLFLKGESSRLGGLIARCALYFGARSKECVLRILRKSDRVVARGRPIKVVIIIAKRPTGELSI